MQNAQAVVLPEVRSEAERLNRGCFCITLDRHALMESLDREVGSPDFAQKLSESHPSLFSNVPAFVPAEILAEMTRVVDAVEETAQLPGYGEAALSWATPTPAAPLSTLPCELLLAAAVKRATYRRCLSDVR